MPAIYIDIDSLRPDHLGCYGYEAPTSPNIDELAEDSIVFENAYTANSPCMPSRAAFLTGRFGLNNGVTTHGTPGRALYETDEWAPTLSEFLFEQRTRTGAVSSFPRHQTPWFCYLWHEFYSPQEPDGPDESFQSVRGETITELATEFVEDHADEEFFLYAQYWDPHGPYQRSDEEIEQFREYPIPPYPTEEQIDEHLTWDAWRSATTPGVGDEGLKHIEEDSITDREVLNELISHYDAEIRYADQQVGEILDHLRERGLYEESLIILTADHGEEFGEHGLYREHWSTHDGTQRVPFLVKPPAGADIDPGTREQLITNVDAAPTIVDYAGHEAPAAWQGRSLRPVVESDEAEWRSEIVVDHGLYTAQRAVRTDRWKFIRTYHPGMWPSVVPDRQLFDVDEDPWEQENVADEHPEVVEDLESRMLRWAEEHRGNQEDSLKRTARNEPWAVRYHEGWDGV